MILEITAEYWALIGLVILLYGLGSYVAGYYIGKMRQREFTERANEGETHTNFQFP